MSRYNSSLPEPCALDISLDQDHPQYESYQGGKGGGWILNFGKHKGTRLNDAPYTYLKWCQENLKNHRPFQNAFAEYHNALTNLVDDEYRDFLVPFGKVYKGKRLRQCRDKPWMLWLLRWANHRANVKNKYDIFLKALQVFLDNPRRQNVHRDVGERLSLTAKQDEEDLLDFDDDGAGLLDPAEYKNDLGADSSDQEDSNPEVTEDRDENGNLKGFVVSDDELESDEETEDEDDEDENEDEDLDNATPSVVEIGDESEDDRSRSVDGDGSETSETDSDESDGSVSGQDAKKEEFLVNDSNNEDDDDEYINSESSSTNTPKPKRIRLRSRKVGNKGKQGSSSSTKKPSIRCLYRTRQSGVVSRLASTASDTATLTADDSDNEIQRDETITNSDEDEESVVLPRTPKRNRRIFISPTQLDGEDGKKTLEFTPRKKRNADEMLKETIDKDEKDLGGSPMKRLRHRFSTSMRV